MASFEAELTQETYNGLKLRQGSTPSPEPAVMAINPSWVPKPTSVRYCWGSYPICNLINDEDQTVNNGYGLPASPFQLTLN